MLSVEILQPCLLDRDNLSVHMRKFGVVLENERRRPGRYGFIPANSCGLYARQYGVVIPLIKPENTTPPGVRVEVSVGQKLPDRPNNGPRFRGHSGEDVGMMIE